MVLLGKREGRYSPGHPQILGKLSQWLTSYSCCSRLSKAGQSKRSQVSSAPTLWDHETMPPLQPSSIPQCPGLPGFYPAIPPNTRFLFPQSVPSLLSLCLNHTKGSVCEGRDMTPVPATLWIRWPRLHFICPLRRGRKPEFLNSFWID